MPSSCIIGKINIIYYIGLACYFKNTLSTPMHRLSSPISITFASIRIRSKADICQYFSDHIILCPCNIDVDKVNDLILQELPEQLKEYLSADRALQEGGAPDHNIPQEYLNTIALPGTRLHRTYLKIDCRIILLPNLDPSSGLCNGT